MGTRLKIPVERSFAHGFKGIQIKGLHIRKRLYKWKAKIFCQMVLNSASCACLLRALGPWAHSLATLSFSAIVRKVGLMAVTSKVCFDASMIENHAEHLINAPKMAATISILITPVLWLGSSSAFNRIKPSHSLVTQVKVFISVIPSSLQPRGLYSPPDSSVHGVLQVRILPFPTPGDLPDPGVEPWSPDCRQPLHGKRILHCLSHQGSPLVT